MNRYPACILAIGCTLMIPIDSGHNHHVAELAASATDRPQKVGGSFASSKLTVNYLPTTANFPNPERGFHDDIELMSGQDFSDVRSKGYTLARTYIRLDEYRNRPLSPAFLSKLDRQLQLIRAAGIKVIPRFTYNFPNGSSDMDRAADASLNLTLAHINQLKDRKSVV